MKNCYLKIFPIIAFLFLLTATDSRAASFTIEVSDFQFSPDTVSMVKGDTVVWIWISGSHTTTSNGIPSGAAPWNVLIDDTHTSFTYVVTEAGTYHYLSVPDLPGMEGVLIVSYPIGISSPVASSASLNIFPNIVQKQINLNFSIPVSAQT